MTKTIKNITPRAPGQTFDVAYLSDLSAVGSDISAKIEHIRKAIGGSQWELSSEALTFVNLNYIQRGSYSIKGAFEELDSRLVSVIGADYGSNIHNIDSAGTVKANIAALDQELGSYIGNSYNIIKAEYTVAQNLEALDSAIGKSSEDGNYVIASNNVTQNLYALDSVLNDIAVSADSAIQRFGSYYTYEGWMFPLSVTYLSAANDLTEALSSLNLGLENATTAGEVTLSVTSGSGGLLSVYTLYQGGVEKGTINIPKDFLVKSAALCVVTVADQPYAGAQLGDKYIDFVINAKDSSETADHIYLPVNNLVDVYTGGSNSEVAVAIDSNNIVTAKLVDSGVTTAKIADANVTTAKIADGAVNTDKIKLVDTADSSKAYTLQVTNGRLQVLEIQA